MKINKIYVGSWYPRTVFHLNELHEFLSNGTSHLSLDVGKLRSLRSSLDPKDVFLGDYFGKKFLSSKFGKYDFENHEGGLMLLSCNYDETQEIKEEMKSLSEFAFKKIFSSFNYLYSLGAPIPKVFSAMRSVMPYVFVVEDGSRDEILSLFSGNGNTLLKEIKNEKIELYYSKSLVVIKGDLKNSEEVIREGIYYINDTENQFQRILDLHRFIWNEISEIKSSRKIKYKNLQKTRDVIMEINSEVIFFKSRIEQLDTILKVQRERVNNMFDKKGDAVWDYVSDRFSSLVDSGEYVKSLWVMTEDYLSGASKLVTTAYQESSSKQINTLQFVFIISAVASILSLGAMVHTDVFLTSNSITGEITGITRSFDFDDLWSLGGLSVLIGALLYFIWDILYKNFSGSKISDPKMIANAELEKIKKMLN